MFDLLMVTLFGLLMLIPMFAVLMLFLMFDLLMFGRFNVSPCSISFKPKEKEHLYYCLGSFYGNAKIKDNYDLRCIYKIVNKVKIFFVGPLF